MSSWGARVLLVDASGYDPLRLIWRVGHLIARPGRFTHRLYVRSWDEAMDLLCHIADRQQLSEVQVWGHGGSGKAFIGRHVLDEAYLRTSPSFHRWAALKPFQQDPVPLIWFRTCYTMKGEGGHAFAALLASELSCRVAGYTQYIHVLQRGLVVASHDGAADWSDEASAGARVCFYTFSPPCLAPLWGTSSGDEEPLTAV